MNVGVVAVLSIVAGFGLVGLALAVAGGFLPVLVVPLGAIGACLLFRAAQPMRVASAPRGTDLACAIGAVAVALAGLIDNLSHSAQHLLIDRDPGAYVNTGRWLASHRSLVFTASVGPFAHTRGLRYNTPGLYGYGRSMHFQFSHLLGVLLAEAHWIGGDRVMLALPAILGAASIVVFYALACRFVPSFLALLATVALAVNVVQLHFTRDAYSEVVVQLVMLGSLWALGLGSLRSRGGGRSRAVFAGVLLGAIVAARIDGPLYIAAIPVLLALAAARRRAGDDDRDDGIRLDVVRPFALAAGAIVLLGILDIAITTPEYVSEPGWRVAAEYGGLILVSIVAVRIGYRAEWWRARFARVPKLPLVVGALFSALLLGLWFVRPYVVHPRGKPISLVGQIQASHHLAVDQGRRYFQDAMRWHAWYLGPFALAAGVIGAGLFLRDTIRRGTIAHWALAVGFGVVATIYLWNASITPDQLWAMRRFVPIVIPGFLLFAVYALHWLARRTGRLGVGAGALLAVAFVAWPLSATLSVRDEVTQPGLLDAVEATCHVLGPHAAVVVLNGPSQLYRQAPQALRGFCNVPVAVRTNRFHDGDLATLAREWRADGRVLYVVGDSVPRVRAALPDAKPTIAFTPANHHFLDQTVDRPPRTYVDVVGTPFVVARVPTQS
jgi:hypothetical protein